jgi:hypothetical protein
MSADTYTNIEFRKNKKEAVNNSRLRTAKAKAQEEYNDLNKEVKKV